MNLPKLAKFASAVLCLFATQLNSQNVNVSGANAGNGTYATLGAAFTAINAGSQSGATIAISVVGNTTETTTANLNAGTWNSITIMPVGARTIIATTAFELFDFNGADRVTVNGLNSGGNSLTFENQNGGSVMWFENDAHNNTLRNLTIRSSDSYGPIVFWTGSATGNDSITVDSCIIGPASTGGNPWNGIYSAGTFGMDNSEITISNCQISNWFTSSWHDGGIYLFNNNTRWTIQNNKLFQTTTLGYVNGYYHYGILLGDGNGYIISGNIIGYASSSGTGYYNMSSPSDARFAAILLAGDPGPASSIDGNIISNIALSTLGSPGFFGSLCGIGVTSGSADIGLNTPNIIGGTSSPTLSLTATTGGAILNGIMISSSGTFNVRNNTIRALASKTNNSTIGGTVYAINAIGAQGSLNISDNTIGNGWPADINAEGFGSSTGAAIAVGIALSSTQVGSCTILGNLIRGIQAFGTSTGTYVAGISTGSNTTNSANLIISDNTIYFIHTNSIMAGSSQGQCSAAGIKIATGTNSEITGNTIYEVMNTNTGTANTFATGIAHANASNTQIARNNIYTILNSGAATSSNSPSASVGILIRSGSGTLTVTNNMVTLGTFNTGNSCFIGIMAQHTSLPDPTLDRIYHNSVNIDGTGNNNQPSFCFLRGDLSGTARLIPVDIRNNVLTNIRGGGTGGHYAIANNYNTTGNPAGWGAGASNYNVLNASASYVGYWSGQRTFAQWQGSSLSDLQSLSGITVNYVNVMNDLHMVAGSNPLIEQAGLPLPGVTDDFDSDPRSTCFVDLGADEFSSPREIGVTGNSVSITDGNTVAVFADHTMFDSTSVCNGTTMRTFTIQNTGLYPLSVSGVTITGANASDFTMTVPPAGTITGSGSTTFTIEFNPSAAGMRTAIINIASNDCDEGTYDFVISGTGAQIVVASITQTNPLCFGDCNGSATVTFAGGIAPYTYLWNFGGTLPTATALCSGTYTVIGTDANGCTASATVTLTEPPLLVVANVSSTDVTTCTVDNGSIDLTISGGTSAYSFAWSNAAISEDLANLPVGTYSCVITDANGCTAATNSILINGPIPPTVTYTESVDTACQTTTNAFALSAGSPAGGTWSGTAVSGNMFDPLNANLGWNVITYSYTDSAAMCTSTAMDSIWVDLCLDVAPIIGDGILVYPVPASSALNISLTSEFTDAKIELMSVDGRVVYSAKANGKTHIINVSSLAAGTYLLRIDNENGAVITRNVSKVD